MFSMPRIGGSDQLNELVADYGGIDAVSRDFHIAPDLLNRYLVGQLEPPITLMLAVYWQCSHGFRQAFSEAHWTHNYNSFRRREMEAKVEYLERVVKHAVQLLEHRVDAMDLLQEALDLAKSVQPRTPAPALASP
jgi:hypothetical protein